MNERLIAKEFDGDSFIDKLVEAGSVEKYLENLTKEAREAEIKRAVQKWDADGRPDFFRVYENSTETFTIVKLTSGDYIIVRCDKIIRLPNFDSY
jgi:hypothetical protein